MKGTTFLKLAERTAIDSAALLKKINSFEELVNLVKLSEYLTEGLDHYHKLGLKTCMIFRKYIEEFENQRKQYKVYVKDEVVIGICQKHPNHI